jgi:bifunctional non-homologous end joining protein LigD
VLWLNDEFVMDETYDRRRDRLATLDLHGALVVVPSWDGMNAPWLFAACEEQCVDGIVLKRRTSTYRPGERSQERRKLTTRHWFEKHAEHRRPK